MNATTARGMAPAAGAAVSQRHADMLRRPDLPAALPVAASRAARLRDRLLDGAFQWAARRIVQGTRRRGLQFKAVHDHRDWAAIRALRRDVYAATIPYMLTVLDATGADEYDHRSIVFGVWLRGRPVATVRYTQWPFEVTCHVPTASLDHAVPLAASDTTLEFSRLLVAPDSGVDRLMPALITYSGLTILSRTSFRHYVGYAKQSVVRKLNRFQCSTGPRSFTIPERGPHPYQVVTGEFLVDARHFAARLCTGLCAGLPRAIPGLRVITRWRARP